MTELIVVELGGRRIVECTQAWQVLETSHPPTYYLPRSAFAADVIVPVAGTTWCEFKGTAHYADLVAGGRRAPRAAWWYPHPTTGYEALLDHLAAVSYTHLDVYKRQGLGRGEARTRHTESLPSGLSVK